MPILTAFLPPPPSASPQGGTFYQVRISVARHGAWRGWGAVRARFEEHLAAQEDQAVIGAHIEWVTQRGRDYVAVTISTRVRATDVVQALAAAWNAFQRAIGDDTAGWDMASATAEIRPETRLGSPAPARPPDYPGPHRGPGCGR